VDALFYLLSVGEDGGYFRWRRLLRRRNGCLYQRPPPFDFRFDCIFGGRFTFFLNLFSPFFVIFHSRYFRLSIP
jgi:hypothetical protein